MRYKMHKKQFLTKITFLSFFLSFFLSACENNAKSSQQLITLTFWHVYGAQINSPLNAVIERFNQSVGKENGVKIVVTSVTNSSAIHDALVAAGRNKVGAPDLPDLFTCYPKTLESMGTEHALDWSEYFTKEELDIYVPTFLEEGRFGNNLLIFPIFKSTNALFINADAFEKFASETNHSYEDLVTFEKFYKTTEAYYNWSGGKSFFMHDEWIQYPMLNTLASGSSTFKDGAIDWKNPHFIQAMTPLLRSGIRGEVCLMPGFATKAIMIDAAISGIESSASVLYFKDIVTYADNTVAPLRVKALPVPYFEGSKRIAIQRGSGLVALKSTEERERAAALFCKWITSEDINLELALKSGYLPVRKNDFERLHSEFDSFEFPRDRYKSLYQAMVKIYQENSFITAPTEHYYGEIEQVFPKALRDVIGNYHKQWINSESKSEELLNSLIDNAFTDLEKTLNELMKERT